MIKFLDEEVEYESIIIMAVQDAAEGLYFSDSDVAFMESLGAGGADCPIRISLFSQFFKFYVNLFKFIERKGCL